jgi:hypothetical protein
MLLCLPGRMARRGSQLRSAQSSGLEYRSMYVSRFSVELGGADMVAAAAHRLKTDGALLVRPDGFVAWHTEAVAEEDPERTLERVLCPLLRRTLGPS